MLWYGEVHGLIIHNALKHDEVIAVGMYFAYLETFFGICDYTAIFAGLSVVDIDIAAPSDCAVVKLQDEKEVPFVKPFQV